MFKSKFRKFSQRTHQIIMIIEPRHIRDNN